ncbi:MAG: M20/M25/M40 family metallo-hydrolase [Myxococcota bacterium]
MAALLVRELEEVGVEARLVATPRGTSQIGRAAAWGRLPGVGGRPPLILLSHLDVVPAEPERWRHAPFGGVRTRGEIIGRGAQDAKGVTLVHLLTLLELARRERPLARDVIFLATPDEETGGVDGAGWITGEHRSLLGGARYVLTEGGGVLTRPGAADAWHVAVTEKTPCWLRIRAEGPPGHSSVPPEQTAVTKLLDALQRIRALERPLRVTPEVARMFAALAPAAPPEDAAGFADLTNALASDPAFRDRFLAQPVYASLVRDTFTLTVLEGAPRTNVLPARAEAHLDARILPGGRCSRFSRRIRNAAGGPGIEIETLLSFPARSSPTDTPLFRAIERVAAAEALTVPRVVSGFTDAHWFREEGLVAYGFVPRWHRIGEKRGIHGPNERISLNNLERGVTTLIEILDALDAEDPP